MTQQTMSRRHHKTVLMFGLWILIVSLWMMYSSFRSTAIQGKTTSNVVEQEVMQAQKLELRQYQQAVFNPAPVVVEKNPRDKEIDDIVHRNFEMDKRRREELLGIHNKVTAKPRSKRPGVNFADDNSNFQMKGKVTYPIKTANSTEHLSTEKPFIPNSFQQNTSTAKSNLSHHQNLTVTRDKVPGKTESNNSSTGTSKLTSKLSNHSLNTSVVLPKKQRSHRRQHSKHQNFENTTRKDPSASHVQIWNQTLLTGKLSTGKQSVPIKKHESEVQIKNSSSFAQNDGSLLGYGREKKSYPTKQPIPLKSNASEETKTKTVSSVTSVIQPEQYPTVKPVAKISNVSQITSNKTHHKEFVISMTLYGNGQRYTVGALKNADLAKLNFPGWTLRIYTEMPSETPKYGLVPQSIINTLRIKGADIHYIVPERDPIPPMMWRFLVADDDAVERFIIRDSDARLTERDAAAVNAWIESGAAFNCIRDHPSHGGYAISGGLWGGWTTKLRQLTHHTWREMMFLQRKNYLEDMNFLNGKIWPWVQKHAYCSDSVSCDRWPGAHPFPVQRYGYEHVGQVIDQHDLGRPQDISILRQAGENVKCVPQVGRILGH